MTNQTLLTTKIGKMKEVRVDNRTEKEKLIDMAMCLNGMQSDLEDMHELTPAKKLRVTNLSNRLRRIEDDFNNLIKDLETN